MQLLLPAVFFLDFDCVEAWMFYFKGSELGAARYSVLSADDKFKDLCIRIVCYYVSGALDAPTVPVDTWLTMGKNASAVNNLLRSGGGTSNRNVLKICQELHPAKTLSLASSKTSKNKQGKHEYPVSSRVSFEGWRLLWLTRWQAVVCSLGLLALACVPMSWFPWCSVAHSNSCSCLACLISATCSVFEHERGHRGRYSYIEG